MRFRFGFVLLSWIVLSFALASAQPERLLIIENVMTPAELKNTGVLTLSPSQRGELDAWLNRYSSHLLDSVGKANRPCDPTIESQIDGEFKGWEGETIYKLRNGQVWQQGSYHYHYHYAYAPAVIIYPGAGGCSMRVIDDDDQAIPVHKLN